MSLEETAKLLSESRKIVYQGKDSNDVTYLLNLILNVVTNVDNRVQKIENKLSKLDEVQAEVNAISLRLGPLERALKETQIKYVEIENSVKGLGNIFDGVKESVEMQAKKLEPIKKECSENKSEIKKLKENVDKLFLENVAKTTENRKEFDDLRNDITDLRCRSMKNNLIFTGLGYNRNENCENKLRDFLYNELNIDKHIELGNVHRFKGKLQNRARPIVARFLYHQDLELVLKRGYMLRGKNFGIKEQFPEEIEKRRQKLYGVMKRAKHEGRNVSLVRDKLYIEGELYVLPDNRREQMEIASSPNPQPSLPQTPSTNENVRQANKRQRIGSSPNPNIA